jgi:hypothetical protein
MEHEQKFKLFNQYKRPAIDSILVGSVGRGSGAQMELPEIDVTLKTFGIVFAMLAGAMLGTRSPILAVAPGLMSAFFLLFRHLESTLEMARGGTVREFVVTLLIGFVGGYGIRGLISRRHAEHRRRHPRRYTEYTMENN